MKDNYDDFLFVVFIFCICLGVMSLYVGIDNYFKPKYHVKCDTYQGMKEIKSDNKTEVEEFAREECIIRRDNQPIILPQNRNMLLDTGDSLRK